MTLLLHSKFQDPFFCCLRNQSPNFWPRDGHLSEWVLSRISLTASKKPYHLNIVSHASSHPVLAVHSLEALTDVYIYRSGLLIRTNDTVLSEMKWAVITIKHNAQNVQNSAFGQLLTVTPPTQNYTLVWINHNTTKNQFIHTKSKEEIIL